MANSNKCRDSPAAGFQLYAFTPINQNPPLAKSSNGAFLEECNASNNTSTNDLGYGFALGNPTNDTPTLSATKCQVNKCVATDNDVGFQQRSGNTFVGNRAENNSTANYQNITGNQVTFTKATGVFSAVPNVWSNISIV